MAVYIAEADIEVTLADRVLETTQTSGTGAYVLDGVSSSGRQSFVAGVGSGAQTVYIAELESAWEIGIGTVTAGAPDTLSRDYIFRTSSDPGPDAAPLDWPTSAVKSVFSDTVAGLLMQILDPARVTDLEDRVAYRDIAASWDLDADNVDVIVINSSTGVNVVKLRVTSGGTGSIILKNAAGVESVDLRARSDRGSLLLNDYEVYPLGESMRAVQATTSGTVKQETGLADVLEIDVVLDQVSLDGTEELIIQIGDAGGYHTSGYTGLISAIFGAGSSFLALSSGFNCMLNSDATITVTGIVTLKLINPSTHVWVANGVLTYSISGTPTGQIFMAGRVDLDTELTQIRATSTGTPDDFDGGQLRFIIKK